MVVWQEIMRYIGLNRADRALFTRAYIGLAVADLSLRFAGFSRLVQDPQGVVPQEGAGDPMAASRPDRYAHWIEVAARYHIVRARCLHRSLVLHRWLLRDGLASHLRIGVRKEGNLLRAHAWVEVDGRAVHEHPGALAAFTPLTSPRLSRSSDSAQEMAGITLWRRRGGVSWL